MEFNTFIVPAEGRTKYGKRQVSSSTTKGSTGGSGGGGGLPYMIDDSGNTVIQNTGNLISPNLFVGRDDISCYGPFSGSIEEITVINNLNSTSTTDALSANQGRVLNSTKQNTLVSGSNIKTINGISILGSGNIVIQGGGSSGSTVLWNQTLTAGTQIAKITINGDEQTVYAPNGGGSTYTAGTNIDITNNVISVTGITSFTGITKANVTTALGYTPLSAETFTSITKANVTTALGYTPLSAETFTSITSQNVVNALGYTPYNSSNPNHYITSATTVNNANNANKLGGYSPSYFVNTATTQSVGGNKTFTEQITGEKDVVCYGEAADLDPNGHLFQFNSNDDEIPMSLAQFNAILKGRITRAFDEMDDRYYYTIMGYFEGDEFHHIYLQAGNTKVELILEAGWMIGTDGWGFSNSWSED